MRISVIIPAFNSERTIRAAVDSVWSQSRAPDEVIVVDDASSDGTCNVIESYDKPCRLIRQERNAGPAAARNRGCTAATGDWIAFLDADDLWLPRRLAVQYECARKDPDIALWCGDVIDFADSADMRDSEGRVGPPVLRAVGGADPPSRWNPLALETFISQNSIATSTVLVKAEALRAVGGFDEQFRGPEDYDLWIRLAAKYELAKLDCPLSAYRQRPGSLSQDDRTFLPQVLGVLRKAFGVGGAMAGLPELETTAQSNQYWNASWMAFNRGSRWRAIRYLLRAYVLNQASPHRVQRKWLPLLLRYVAGRRDVQTNT